MNSPFLSLILHLALVGVAASWGCNAPSSEPTAGSETHFLTACDDSCGSGLSCLCGTCTSSCGASSECAKLNPAAICVAASVSDAGSTCEQTQTVAHCDVACIDSSECASFGADFFCSRGYCRSDPLSRSGEPFPGYGSLCGQSIVSCAVTESPPSIVGTYTGEATVVLSSNALWAVRDVSTFSAALTDQTNGLLAGSVAIPSLAIIFQNAIIRGQSPAFSMYDSTYVDLDGCNLETRSVLSGAFDATANPATITGGLALRFTGNYSGNSCSAEQIDTYPATGANFTIAATLSP
jgi:hypothetical protein